MTTADTGAQAPPGAVNGQSPGAGPAAEECETCVTKGEIVLAIVVGLIGVGIVLMAADTGTGGKISGWIGLRGRGEEAGGDDGGA